MINIIYNCIDCEKKLNTRNKKQLRCWDCFIEFIKVENRFCCDCGKKLNKYKEAERCLSCNNKFQWKNGKRTAKSKYIIPKEFLKEEYIDNKKSAEEISKIIGCNKTNIYRYLRKYNIPIRSNSESHIGQKKPKYLIEKFKKIFKGSGNPNWNGGLDKSGYPFYFSDELKLEIRQRDNFTCQNPECNCKEENHYRGKQKINLIIHHINYNKQNCDESNLITVCNICNTKANGNRDYWFAFYTYIMENEILKGA